MTIVFTLLKLLHIVAVVFMSAPLYALIIVNERAGLGPTLIYSVDRYMENMIRKNAIRCFVFQATALVTGLGLILFSGQGLVTLFSNWVLTAKTLILFILVGLLSYIHFKIQPKIEEQLAGVQGDPIPEDVARVIRPLRLRRKRLAGLCLFLVLSAIILGLQVYGPYPYWLNVGIMGLAALFAYRVYKTPIPFGWF
jgi:uncharacterized membrane protein